MPERYIDYVIRITAGSPNGKVPIPDDAIAVTVIPITGSSDVRLCWLERDTVDTDG